MLHFVNPQQTDALLKEIMTKKQAGDADEEKNQVIMIPEFKNQLD